MYTLSFSEESMNDRRQYLLELAKRNVKAYIANSKVKAAMVAEGLCDEYSDIDMSIYYSDLPTDEELHIARQQNQGSERLWVIGDRSDGGFVEAYLVDGVECQFGHVTIAQWEQDIANILEKLDVKSPLMKAMSGTLICIPLYNEILIQQWKAKVAEYPDALAQAMVEQHLHFFPLWGVQQHLAERDATLFYYQVLVEAAQNLLGVLSGLNRLYYSTFQFKRMRRFVEQMSIAPKNVADRIESLFHAAPDAAAVRLEALVQKTLDLVDIHMPQVDTSLAKRRLGWRKQPWQPPSEK
jgi:hypothetical protein